MAEEKTTPAPTPPPTPAPTPAPSVAARAKAEIDAVKTGRSLTRPFRYSWAFACGTVGGGLDGIANWGPRTMKYGAVAGVVVGIALGGFAPVLIGAAAGFLLGVTGGAAHGLLTGGMRAVGRLHRGERYAEDLVQRSQVQRSATPSTQADYRGSARARALREGMIAQQVLEREAEVRRDSATYWQDRERGSQASGRGMGY